MTHFNFKKMYLLSCEKYDMLKAMSVQENTNIRSNSSSIKIPDNDDTQSNIHNTVNISNQQKRIMPSLDDDVTSVKKRKILPAEDEVLPDVIGSKCYELCNRKRKSYPGKDNPNTYKKTKSTQTANVNKTKPFFRKTFKRIYKTRQGTLEKKPITNNNGKRYRESPNTNTNDEQHVLNNKKKRYNGNVISSSSDNIPISKSNFFTTSVEPNVNTNKSLLTPPHQTKKTNISWLKLL